MVCNITVPEDASHVAWSVSAIFTHHFTGPVLDHFATGFMWSLRIRPERSNRCFSADVNFIQRRRRQTVMPYTLVRFYVRNRAALLLSVAQGQQLRIPHIG